MPPASSSVRKGKPRLAAANREDVVGIIGRHAIRVGFVPLIDAAPLIVAAALGFFADEGLDVSLRKQIGWGNVRDRLTYAELDASHAPLGMVPASLAGVPLYDESLGALCGLSAGGNAITVARPLIDFGVADTAPAAWRRHLGRPIRLAYVTQVGTHHFALCELVKAAGLRMGEDVTLSILPPAQMAGLLERGVIDGYCAGEPWNTLAVASRAGAIFRTSAEWSPDHPEKALLVTRRWHAKHPAIAGRLARAVLRGCDYCEEASHHNALTELLARPEHLGLDESVIARSLTIDRWLSPTGLARGTRRPRFRTFARDAIRPTVDRIAWIARQMRDWQVLQPAIDPDQLAAASLLPDADLNLEPNDAPSATSPIPTSAV